VPLPFFIANCACLRYVGNLFSFLKNAFEAARFAEIAISNSAGELMSVCIENVVCCQVEVSATGRSPVQRRPSERVSLSVISEYEEEACLRKTERKKERRKERKKERVSSKNQISPKDTKLMPKFLRSA